MLQFSHPATEDGRAPHGLSITKSVVVSGTGAYGHVNSVNFKVTALINGDKRYIFVNPKNQPALSRSPILSGANTISSGRCTSSPREGCVELVVDQYIDL